MIGLNIFIAFIYMVQQKGWATSYPTLETARPNNKLFTYNNQDGNKTVWFAKKRESDMKLFKIWTYVYLLWGALWLGEY